MSTSIITQFSQIKSDSLNVRTSSIAEEVASIDAGIEVCNAITHKEGKDKFTDYEIKVKSNSPLIQKMNLDMTTSVRRRYKDFVRLHKELHSLRLNLPKLPGKQFKVSMIPAFNKKNFKEEFIKQRCKELEKFLNKLAANPLAQSNEAFQQFFQDENPSEN